MANRAYLLNAKTLTSNPYELYRAQSDDKYDPHYIEVAEYSYGIPLPWLCCFRPAQLRPVEFRAADLYHEPKDPDARVGPILLPSATRDEAVANLEAALPLFQEFASSKREARGLWKEAVKQVRALPLDYVTLSVMEILDTDDDRRAFEASFSADEAAIPHLRRWSRDEEDFLQTHIHYEVPRRPQLTAEEARQVARFPGLVPEWLELRRKWVAANKEPDTFGLELWGGRLERCADQGYAQRVREHVKDWGPGSLGDWGRPVRDWERFGASDLSAYADVIFKAVVRDALARGRFDAQGARRAFAADYTAKCIQLHVVAENRRHGLEAGNHCARRDIRLAALGLVLGVEEQARALGRAWIEAGAAGELRDDGLTRYDLPGNRLLFDLVALELAIAVRERESQPHPELTRLLDVVFADGRSSEFREAWIGACNFHTRTLPGFGHDTWLFLPLVPMLVREMRARRGLAIPDIDHPWLAGGFREPPAKGGWECGPLVERVRARLAREGFDEAALFGPATVAWGRH